MGTTTTTDLPARHARRTRRALAVLAGTCALFAATLPAAQSASAGPGLSAPGAPTAITVRPLDRAFVVFWTAPTSSATVPPATAYQATATAVGLPTLSCTTATTTCLIDGVVNPTTAAANRYTVTVVARNSVGWGRTGTARGTYAGTTRNANLAGTNLAGANLSGRNLTNANLAGANLAGTNLATAKLAGVRSGNVNGTPTALPTNWRVTNGYLAGPSANLTNANLGGANLRNANLNRANLTGAALTYAKLSGARLYLTRLRGANLTGANLTSASLPLADLTDATLTDANLTDAYLNGASLVNTSLYAALLIRADLMFANLTGAYLRLADLTDAVLQGADLTDADFTSAVLTGAICPNSITHGSPGADC